MTQTTSCQYCDLDEYTIEDGIIRSPGKFEGEPAHALHFYHYMMDGSAEVCACGACYMSIDAEDAALFPDLADSIGGYVHLSVSDSGFVYTEVVSAKELEEHEAENMEEDEERDA
jgi:hypothetical protein